MYKKMLSYTILFYIIFNLKDFIKNNINKDNILNENDLNENDSNKNCNIFNKIKEILIKYKLKLSKNIDEINEKNKIFEENINPIECNKIVLYEHKKKSNYNLKDVYNNFFFKKEHKINKEIDIDILKNINNDNKNDLKNNIILCETKNNILLDEINNFLLFNFESNENNYYNIKCKLKMNNVNNVKLIINDSNKKFVYDFLEENEYLGNINEYNFILNYNKFNVNDSIFIYLLFYNDLMSNIIIDSVTMEIIENKIAKDNFKLYNSIIIFSVNNKYLPVYTNNQNILDFKKNDYDNLFF